MRLEDFIAFGTRGVTSVVDFGSGPGDKLAFVDPGVTTKIALDKFGPYWSQIPSKYSALTCDALEYEKFIPEEKRDCAMLLDLIEHMDKEKGADLLERLKTHFRVILIFTPLGYHAQDIDVTGMMNPYQIHRSGWSVEDLTALGFHVEADPAFHGPRGGAIFATWRRT